MITLSASGGSVTFEFSGNSTYLNDGQITVPVNSLALIIDESDMVTFKKSQSNDIFVSANIAEFGMTKAELESWYKANMVGSTGGGGGVTSGEVQTMIDEAVSGKVDTEDLDVSGKTLYKVYTVDDGTDFSGFSASSVRIFYNGARNAYEEQITVRAKDASDNLAAITISLTATTASGITGFTISEIGDISNKISVSLVNGELVATVTDNDFKIVSVAYTNSTDTKNVTISFIVPFEIESGSTPDVVEEGVYNALESISDDVNAIKNSPSSVYANEAWAKSIRDLSWYPSLSGLTLEYSLLGSTNWEFVAQPLDDSIRYGKRVGETGTDRYLGVYASGDTHTVTANTTNQTYTLALEYSALPVRKAVMHLNQSYTGVLPTARAILSSYIDNSGTNYKAQWSYNSGTDSFTNTTSYTGITLTYDNVAKTVTLELDPSYKSIMTVDSYSRIAPSTALTQNNCYIGLVTIDTNSYKLQEALDNKQDQLVAGENITISGNVISANGGGNDTYVSGISVGNVGGTMPSIDPSLDNNKMYAYYEDNTVSGYSFTCNNNRLDQISLTNVTKLVYTDTTCEYGSIPSNYNYANMQGNYHSLKEVEIGETPYISSYAFAFENEADVPSGFKVTIFSETPPSLSDDGGDNGWPFGVSNGNTYPIYVPNVATYSAAIAKNSTTWGQLYGNRLKQIVPTGGTNSIILSYNDTSKTAVSVPVSSVTEDVVTDELRYQTYNTTETTIQWNQSDGGESANYPAGCTKVQITVDAEQMTEGYYYLKDSDYNDYGGFSIVIDNGVITVTADTSAITYSISNNIVTVEYPTIDNVAIISTSYDNWWLWKAITKTPSIIPLKSQVEINTDAIASILQRLSALENNS